MKVTTDGDVRTSGHTSPAAHTPHLPLVSLRAEYAQMMFEEHEAKVERKDITVS